ncbi:MAG: ABC transporter permease [Gemmatimonadales bacterium]
MTPPRLAERLLLRLLRRHPAASYLAADLREEFAARGDRGVRAAARYWVAALALGTRMFVSHTIKSRPSPGQSRGTGDLMRSELTLALRAVGRRPVVSGAIVLTIAGALAVTAIAFSVVNGVLLAPLPYPESGRLVAIWEQAAERGRAKNVVSPANYLAWTDQFRTVGQLSAMVETSAAITGGGDPEQVGVVYTAGPFFALVGGMPLLGRFYTAAEDSTGRQVAVITEALWRRRYGADPAVIGRSLDINGRPHEILGVVANRQAFAPALSFAGVGSRDLYVPLQLPPAARQAGGRYLQVIGRLAPGATVAAAAAEGTTIADRLRAAFPERQSGWDVQVVALRDDVVGDVRTPITIVFAAVLLVLLIACANIASLLMTRATERRPELAIRAALGAGRGALVRQLFGESFVMAGLGGMLGGLVAAWGVRVLVAATPDLPRLTDVRFGGEVVGFTALLSLAVAGLIGVGPALEVGGRSPAGWLLQRGVVTERHAHRARRALVGFQVALSLVLLVGAGLLIRSLANQLRVDLGFEDEHLVTAQLSLPNAAYRSGDERAAVFEALSDRVSRMPGVRAASFASILPMTGSGQATGFFPLDRPPPEFGKESVADVRFVHHGYFDAMGIALREGRYLADADRPGTPVVAVINETGARLLWPDQSAVGKRIAMEWGDTVRAEIVGVVSDVRLDRPDRPADRATIYWDYRQLGTPNTVGLVVRGTGADPAVAPIREALKEIAPAVPLYRVNSVATLRSQATARVAFLTKALAVFSTLALVLAALGTYGVMAYAVQQRTREIGVRLALGADRRTVISMLIGEAARILVPALLIGSVAAFAMSSLLRSQVFGVSLHDPLTFLSGLLVIGGVALLASWVPARRASRIPPVEAMRSD